MCLQMSINFITFPSIPILCAILHYRILKQRVNEETQKICQNDLAGVFGFDRFC